MHDLVIKDANIVDGTGAPARRGDVAVDGGRITELDRVDTSAQRTIDAQGRTIAPGFIDVHTHLDVQAFWDTALTPSPFHGVTTVFAGNCGFSVAPLRSSTSRYLMEMLARVEDMPLKSLEVAVPWDWESTEQFIDRLDGRLAVNTGYMVGHSALRAAVMGDDANSREATSTEIEQMSALLAEGLRAGGMGFSTTGSVAHLDYQNKPVPSRWAHPDEFVTLAAVCRDFPGTSLEYTPGLPGPLDPEQVERMTAMSSAAQRPLNWNIMFPSVETIDTCRENLAISERASERGARLVALAMSQQPIVPFRFRSRLDTIEGVYDFLAESDDDLARRFSDAAGSAGFIAATQPFMDQPRVRRITRWEAYRILEGCTEQTRAFEGRLVGEIAAQQHKAPFDVLCEIIVADRFRTLLCVDRSPETHADWSAAVEVWRSGSALLGGSDAGAHLAKLATFNYPTVMLEHAYRLEQLLTLEEAVRLLTSAPADLYGMMDRGRLTVGATADLVVFDETTVGAEPVRIVDDLPAGASRLYGASVGIGHVLVAGTEIARDGQVTGSTPGRVLRSGVDTHTPSMN